MESTSTGYSGSGPNEATALRSGITADVRAALLRARVRTLAIADAYARSLGPGLAVPYRTDLNPPLWELGHVAWFQEWWIARNEARLLGHDAPPGARRGDSALHSADALFDSARVEHASRWQLALPSASATRDYLAATLARTLALLAELPAMGSDAQLYFFRLVALHEEMHAEAALYMAQTLELDIPCSAGPRLESQVRTLALPSQDFQLGSPEAGFAFDNERRGHGVRVAKAEIDAEPVSWRRFLAFVEDGGYEPASWWGDTGRDWLMRQPLRQPAGVRRFPGGWKRRVGKTWVTLDLDTAATHLTAFEAEAWCRWAGRSLPSEAEWECAALTVPGFRWGQVWEWTRSEFAPYPGFRPHPYREYSQPWFGSRRVLRGASPATAPSLAHARYRNFFEPGRRDVFAGFRSRNPHGAETGAPAF